MSNMSEQIRERLNFYHLHREPKDQTEAIQFILSHRERIANIKKVLASETENDMPDQFLRQRVETLGADVIKLKQLFPGITEEMLQG